MSESTKQYSAPAAACAAEVLLALRGSDKKSLAELHRELGGSKGLIFRVLHELIPRGLVERDAGGLFQLGIAAFEISAAYLTQTDPQNRIRELMQAFAEEHKTTITLGVLQDTEVLYLMKFVGPRLYGTVAGVGERLPANCLAIGKALLADLPDAVVRKRFRNGLSTMTPSSLSTIDELLAELDRIRARGYATNAHGAAPGRAGIAVTVELPRTMGGTVGIGASLEVGQLDERLDELVARLLELRTRFTREEQSRAAFATPPGQ